MTTPFTMTVDEMRRADFRIDALCKLADDLRRLRDLVPDEEEGDDWSPLKALFLQTVGWDRDRTYVGLTVRPHSVWGNPDGTMDQPEPVTQVDEFLRSHQAYHLIQDYCLLGPDHPRVRPARKVFTAGGAPFEIIDGIVYPHREDQG